MASQFHDVLRDFALEKMKEMEDCGTPKISKNVDHGDVINSSKGDNTTRDESESTSKEGRGSKERHHKHSKKDGHHRKSKRKDKKSSSSRHKKKSKKKSSHHKSRHHKRKDRETSRKTETGVSEGVVSQEIKETTEIIKSDSSSEDSDAVIQVDAEGASSSSDDSDTRSVSPPIQLGKDFLAGVLRDTARRSDSADNSGNDVNDEKAAFREILAERKAKKRAGLDLLSRTREMIIKRCGLEEKQPANVEHASQKVDRGNMTDQKAAASSSGGSKQPEVDFDLGQMTKTFPETTDRQHDKSNKAGRDVTEQKGASPVVSKMLNDRVNVAKSKPSTSSKEDEGIKVKKGLSPSHATLPIIMSVDGFGLRQPKMDSEVSVDKDNNNRCEPPNNDHIRMKDNGKFERAEAREQKKNTSTSDQRGTDAGVPGTDCPDQMEATNVVTKTAPKAPARAKMIQIKIKTLELPTDPKTLGEDEGRNDRISEDEEEEMGDDGGKSDKPWRIVPEEGELTPSTASDEGHEMLEEAFNAETSLRDKTKEETSKDSKESTGSSRKHRKSKKRKKEGREEGEIVDKKKKRRHRDQEKSKEGHAKTTEDGDSSKTRSESPDNRKVKSSVSRADSSKHSLHGSRSRSRNRSRSQSPGRGLNHRSRSRSPDTYRRRSRSPEYHKRLGDPGHRRSRSRSRSPVRGHSFDLRDKLRSRRRTRDTSRSRSRSPQRNRRERSYTPVEEIDKKKLLEIAKANAYLYQKVQAGELPTNTKLPQFDTRKGGQTVDELTEVCKGLLKRDDEDSSDEEPVNVPVTSDDESFIRHPFNVKERPLSITLNIQNSIPMPIQNSKEKLRFQFPVSSGAKHREKVDSIPDGSPFGSWGPVTKVETIAAPSMIGAAASTGSGAAATTTTAIPAVPTPSVAPLPPVPPAPVPEEHRVFVENPRAVENVNIADVIAMRLKAARQLESNPLDVEALTNMHKAQSQLKNWANKDQKPGLFSKHTDATFLTPNQLANPNPKTQAWAKKDMFHNHMPVSGGIGMHLLQKMGWRMGEGLGKYKDGSQHPLMLDVKMDRKGLAVKSAVPARRPKFNTMMNRAQKVKQPKPKPQQQAYAFDLADKHPVSALNEFCSKKKWPQPEYLVLRDVGPAHKKEFIYKVVFNGKEFAGAMACNSKKEAKALAAKTALVELCLVASTS